MAQGALSFIGGGVGNITSNPYAVVTGGDGNQAGNDYSFVGGGFLNTAFGTGSVVVGGGNDGVLIGVIPHQAEHRLLVAELGI